MTMRSQRRNGKTPMDSSAEDLERMRVTPWLALLALASVDIASTLLFLASID